MFIEITRGGKGKLRRSGMGETDVETYRHAAPTELEGFSITGSRNMPLLTELGPDRGKKLPTPIGRPVLEDRSKRLASFSERTVRFAPAFGVRGACSRFRIADPRDHPKAPASRTHSKRFAALSAACRTSRQP